MEHDVQEYYDLLLEMGRSAHEASATAYRRLRELLEHLCRTQLTDSSLQMTDLSARISFVAAKIGLSVAEQNRLHTIRLTSNAVLNRQTDARPAELLRDIKTTAFFIRRLTGTEIPEPLYRLLPRTNATYLATSAAHSYCRRMRVTYLYAKIGRAHV